MLCTIRSFLPTKRLYVDNRVTISSICTSVTLVKKFVVDNANERQGYILHSYSQDAAFDTISVYNASSDGVSFCAFSEICCNTTRLWECWGSFDPSVAPSLHISDHGLVVRATVCTITVWPVAGLYFVVDVVGNFFLVVWASWHVRYVR